MKNVTVDNRIIGDGRRCYILAEAGCNHNGSLEIARKLIDMAAQSKADGIKFQTYHAENMYSRKTPMMEHFRKRLAAPENATMFDLIKMTELPWELHEPIVEYCRKKDVPFLSTPFDEDAVDFLEQFEVPAYKIAAFEMTHFPLIRKVVETQKPIILSTGMSSLGDIERVLSIFHKAGNDRVILLHCVSNYPSKPGDANLRVIPMLKQAFGYPVGLSDHTPGIEVSKIAIALGANLIEKHITIDQRLPGPDHYFSLTPLELNELVTASENIETMLGTPQKKCTESELEMKHIGRRSLVAACDIQKGVTITREMLAVKRPGFGLDPGLIDILIGKMAVKNIEEDEPILWDMFIQSG
jgi:sialic acid synthase SpsE|tara:strand:+ start:871 stop:1935 length:1065 start_codon:yes stop_codon:yes gene_type:complete